MKKNCELIMVTISLAVASGRYQETDEHCTEAELKPQLEFEEIVDVIGPLRQSKEKFIVGSSQVYSICMYHAWR